MARHLAWLLLLALASAARADTLADLKRTLAGLRGTAAIAATYEARETNVSKGRFFNQNLNVRSSGDVQAGAGGVTVTLSHATIERLRAQRMAPRFDENGAERTGDVAPARVAELLDYAPTMQAMLARAVVVGEREAAFGGTPARLLMLKVPPERGPKSDVKVSNNGDAVSLWIGRDGVPLAAERKSQFSAGFLFIKATGTATEKWTFIHRDDRLVVTRHERVTSGSGMGQSSNGTELQILSMK